MEFNSSMIFVGILIVAYFAYQQGRVFIAQKRVAALIAAGSPLIIIDVRSPAEYAERRIAGSVNIPLDRVRADIGRAAPDTSVPLVIYCQSGSRAKAASGILKGLGYARVVNLGGINAWRGEFAYGALKKNRR